jgi:hypothetical protein
MVVTVRGMVFWFVRLCSSESAWHFGRTYCLHIQDPRISQARNQHEAGSKQNLVCCASCLLHAVFFFFCLAYFLTLKVELMCFSEMSVNFHQITWCLIRRYISSFWDSWFPIWNPV